MKKGEYSRLKREPSPRQSHDEEERKSLIPPEERHLDKQYDEEENAELAPPSRSRRCLVFSVLFFSLLLLTIAIPYRRFFSDSDSGEDEAESGSEGGSRLSLQTQGLLSNGTHEFKKSALIVSIDGLRADYLDRGLTPHLLAISKDGLRAKSMKPIFPTLTFPNHWALMTGLHAESHGIVGNNFWDPATGLEFQYNRAESAWISGWWFGEPMWETAEKAGVRTANLMWPGPPKTSTGASSTYFIPWKDKVPLKEKLDQILAWIDMPLEKRPQFIMAYEPSLDQAGHSAGPTSKLVDKVLKEVDVFAQELHDEIEARNLTDIFDIVFVSDHGMTDTSHPELIFIDDILGEGWKHIEHEDGWPAMGFRFDTEENTEKYYNVLLNASALSDGKFDVFTHATMPERWHFVNNQRIAPIYVVPRIGYALTNRIENGSGMNKGSHGYDNEYKEMHAMFVAHGPFSSVVKAIEADRIKAQANSKNPVRRFLDPLLGRDLARPNKGWHSTSEDTYVMETFDNVEIYNLMMKLLGVEEHAAPTNGTKGFWDKYF
ncbi:Phosphodiest-domain-containing protein [Lentinus tigrinus ALCF2SS1-7]|uniref:Phosphodiest-domain-containing protein n=1 Tax=Lentinus tigrinus ALCF2SS1-6 TaxID=1328759 RepID=A0A5C2SHG1_9APHY|nr:Phosphodiest-domain-containing protein [Lentinus tigrinus ALCF2SS1-6]RPD77519.1 Phosphodiest-domain-containing protein [Lentinus tigrinus ALCF2SS1-7]